MDQLRHAYLAQGGNLPVTQCCSAAVILQSHPHHPHAEAFCGGCLTSIVVSGGWRWLALQTEWPWHDARGGRSAPDPDATEESRQRAIVEEAAARERAAAAMADALEAFRECASVRQPAAPDISAIGRVGCEVGEAVAAAVFLFALRLSVVAWRMAG